ncbi:MAG: helix-turn-helix transcriptional regulator [Paenibacillus sp.]|nr:helix-turn-helix transcriptional regulator [Paenibacillus sp.]MDU2240451.1 helix-turn-helix transcriptional regulator [Paenibacillus sp.]
MGGVERGDRNISLESLEKIATALDIPAGELFLPEVVLNSSCLMNI